MGELEDRLDEAWADEDGPAEEAYAEAPKEQAEVGFEEVSAGTLVAEMRARHMSRNGIMEELVDAGLTEDEATDAFEGEVFTVRREVATGRLSSPAGSAVPQDPPSGIGGWLLVPAINLAFMPLVYVGAASEAVSTLGSPGLAELEEQAPGITRVITAGLVMNAFLLVFVLVTIVFFFSKKRVTRRLYVLYLAVDLGAVVLHTLYGYSVLGGYGITPGELIGRTVFAAVWIGYFLSSDRVANTFVR